MSRNSSSISTACVTCDHDVAEHENLEKDCTVDGCDCFLFEPYQQYEDAPPAEAARARAKSAAKQPQLAWEQSTRNAYVASFGNGTALRVERSRSWKTRAIPKPWRVVVLGQHWLVRDGFDDLGKAMVAAEKALVSAFDAMRSTVERRRVVDVAARGLK